MNYLMQFSLSEKKKKRIEEVPLTLSYYNETGSEQSITFTRMTQPQDTT